MAEIIVLDDVQDACILVGKILSKQGHVVHTFTEEEEAVSYIRNNLVELAILDIKLKKMSGVEVLAVVKSINPEIGVMMLTGYPTIETARDSISFGADEYCVKPIDREELENKVEKILRKKREQKEVSFNS